MVDDIEAALRAVLGPAPEPPTCHLITGRRLALIRCAAQSREPRRPTRDSGLPGNGVDGGSGAAWGTRTGPEGRQRAATRPGCRPTGPQTANSRSMTTLEGGESNGSIRSPPRLDERRPE